MKVKLLSYNELKKKGYLYYEYSDRIIITNGEGSWKAIPKAIFNSEFLVTNDKAIITEEDYKAYSDLFVEVVD